jgi:hypothetical protein
MRNVINMGKLLYKGILKKLLGWGDTDAHNSHNNNNNNNNNNKIIYYFHADNNNNNVAYRPVAKQ